MDFSSNCTGNSGLFPSCLMKMTAQRALKNPKHDTSKTVIIFFNIIQTTSLNHKKCASYITFSLRISTFYEKKQHPILHILQSHP